MASKLSCFFKKVDDGQSPPKNTVSVSVLFSLSNLKMGLKGCPDMSVRITTLCYVISQDSADLTPRFGDAGLRLAAQDLNQSDPV